MIAESDSEVRQMKAAWYHYFKGKQPHTKVIKRESCYSICFWLAKEGGNDSGNL
jgi:hypothetical protein